MTVSYHQFYNNCLPIVQRTDRQGASYFEGHSQRFYQTFVTCAALLKPGQKVLSVGAGSAYVEFQLSRTLQVEVTVLDFERANAYHQELYDEHGFHTFGADVAKKWSLPENSAFDLIMCCEIVEHLPIPPSQHFSDLARYLMTGGYLVVTTPNLARFMNLWRLMRHIPIFDEPEKTFHTSHFSHEHIHRREYVELEIRDAIKRAGLQHCQSKYIRNQSASGPFRKLFAYPIEAINPGFMPTMIIVARG